MAGGKRTRRSIYGRTRREVAEKLKVVQRQVQQGVPLGDDRMTVAEWLDAWLAQMRAQGAS